MLHISEPCKNLHKHAAEQPNFGHLPLAREYFEEVVAISES